MFSGDCDTASRLLFTVNISLLCLGQSYLSFTAHVRATRVCMGIGWRSDQLKFSLQVLIVSGECQHAPRCQRAGVPVVVSIRQNLARHLWRRLQVFVFVLLTGLRRGGNNFVPSR